MKMKSLILVKIQVFCFYLIVETCYICDFLWLIWSKIASQL